VSEGARRPGPTQATERTDRLGELAAMREFSRLALHAPRLMSAPRGRGGPVLLLPGLGGGDLSLGALRAYLTTLGHRANGWSLGTNDGDLDWLLPRAGLVVSQLAERSGRPVALVGQSLGGYVARELAREHPDVVAQVVTFGTPMIRPRSRRPILCTVTVIASRADRIVPWRTCVDPSPEVNNIEVRSTHLGMGIDPDVWLAVARQLRATAPGPAPV
jgi:pimeloyl-ACP methyl ester carboxylesterase